MNYKSRWETPTFTGFCYETLGVDAVTFEVPYALSARLVFTRERYQEAGARMAAAVVAQLNSPRSHGDTEKKHCKFQT